MASAANFQSWMLKHFGVASTTQLPAEVTSHLLYAFNRALQEIFRDKQRETLGCQVYGPTPVTLGAVTQGSTAITFSGFQAWMAGCTIVITGDTRQNLLEKRDAAVSLAAPYQGPTGTNVAATVYGDAVNFSSEFTQLYGPAKLDDRYLVEPLNTRREMELTRRAYLYNDPSVSPKTQRRPLFFTLEDNLQYQAPPGTRIVFDSLPDTPYVLTLDAMLRPPRIVDFTDPREYFIPAQADESVLWPWARLHCLDHPQFVQENLSAITASAQSAQQTWEKRSHGFTHTFADVQTF